MTISASDLGSCWRTINKQKTVVGEDGCTDGLAQTITLAKSQEAIVEITGLLAGESYEVLRVKTRNACGDMVTTPAMGTTSCCPDQCGQPIVIESCTDQLCLTGPATYMLRFNGTEMGEGSIEFQVC